MVTLTKPRFMRKWVRVGRRRIYRNTSRTLHTVAIDKTRRVDSFPDSYGLSGDGDA